MTINTHHCHTYKEGGMSDTEYPPCGAPLGEQKIHRGQ